MKRKYCPNCGKSGKVMQIWRGHSYRLLRYHVECPHCHWCGRPLPFKFLAELDWNYTGLTARERRKKIRGY